jgi:hypothetical protein
MKKRFLNGIPIAVLTVGFTLLIEHGTRAYSGFRENWFGYMVMLLIIVFLQQINFSKVFDVLDPPKNSSKNEGKKGD